ncbi:MAG TPA: KH domain-containing protein [Iamia sp.]
MSDELPADDVAELDDTADEAVEADDASDEVDAPETAVAVLEYLAKALVADPDGVRVEADDANGLTLNVYVSDGDMGRVIGKRGRVANAIRSIGRAAAAKDGETGVAIEFVD